VSSSTPATSNTLRQKIVAGSITLISGSALVTVINLGYNISVAKFLGPQEFGQATVVYTILTLISAITLSFQILSAKSVAKQKSLAEKLAVYHYLHRASWVWSIFAGCLLFSFRQDITSYLRLPSPTLVLLLAIGAAFYIPLGCRRGYVQGAYGFRKLATNLVLEGATRLGGSLLMIAVGLSVEGVVAANAAAMIVAWLSIGPGKAERAANPLFLRETIPELTQAMVFFAGQVLINNSDIVLVKHFFPSTTAGIYAAVAMVGRVIFSFSNAVVNSMFPIVAGSREQDRKSLTLISTSLLLVLGIGGVMTITLRLIPATLWAMMFGAGFRLTGVHTLPYLLSLYAASTVIYSLSAVVIAYEMSYKISGANWVQLLFSGLVIVGISRFHDSLTEVIMVQVVLMITLLVAVAVPFAWATLRRANSPQTGQSRNLRFLRRVSEDEVIGEFLKGDFEHPAYADYHTRAEALVYDADYYNQADNRKRRALLFMRHGSLWRELPADTQWFEVSIKESDFNRIRVFPRAHWRKITNGSFEFSRVMERTRDRLYGRNSMFFEKIAAIRYRMRKPGALSGAVLLIGTNGSSPLTVLDGNHRFVAAALEGRTHQLNFFCGLTPRMIRCCWYRTNIVTLGRYATNMVRNITNRQMNELAELFQTPETASE
jgi:O-antigen/teichoic acid export membrane protein